MTGLVLHSFAAGAMAPDTAAEITALNAVTASAGLSLSQAQATALAASRVETLASTGRIEFGHGVTEKLILAFYTSPYLTKCSHFGCAFLTQAEICSFRSSGWKTASAMPKRRMSLQPMLPAAFKSLS